jgi:hypothetical protein
MSTTEQPKHYRFSFNGIKLDPYRIMQVYGITHPAHQHAVKKLLRCGNSVKPLLQDIDEVILSLNRWKEMINEEAAIAKAAAPEHPTTQAEAFDRLERIQSNRRGRGSVRAQSRLAKGS